MGYKVTEDMGYTIDWTNALEKRVTDRTETTICEFGAERSIYVEQAV